MERKSAQQILTLVSSNVVEEFDNMLVSAFVNAGIPFFLNWKIKA
jgi:hypothetical protein